MAAETDWPWAHPGGAILLVWWSGVACRGFKHGDVHLQPLLREPLRRRTTFQKACRRAQHVKSPPVMAAGAVEPLDAGRLSASGDGHAALGSVASSCRDVS